MKSVFFLLMLLPGLAFAKPSLDLGFYSIDHLKIPTAVQNASRFIFRLQMPNFTSVLQKHYVSLSESPQISKEAKADLKACLAAGMESCLIPLGEIRGTAFLEGSGSSIWTNCHIVASWIQYRKQQLRLAGVSEKEWLKELWKSEMPMRLSNAQQQVLFNTAKRKDTANLVAAVMTGSFTPQELECSMRDDAVKIQLSKALAERGLPLAAEPQKFSLEQTVYIGGFPRNTEGSREARGQKDSDGLNFHWTIGNVLPKARFSDYFSNNNYGFVFNTGQAILADGAEGMSGGPVLNSAGQLMGIYKGFLPEPGQKEIPLVGMFFDLDELGFIKAYAKD